MSASIKHKDFLSVKPFSLYQVREKLFEFLYIFAFNPNESPIKKFTVGSQDSSECKSYLKPKQGPELEL